MDGMGVFTVHCAGTILCVGCPKAEDTVHHSEAQHMAMLIPNKEKDIP